MQLTEWQKPSETQRFGIAISSLSGNAADNRILPLCIGDTLNIDGVFGAWYHGHKASSPQTDGIFPATYVHLVPETRRRSVLSNNTTESSDGSDECCAEVCVTLRKWWALMKAEYVTSGCSRIEPMQKLMHELLSLRRQLQSGSLPKDQQKQVQTDCARLCDVGNDRLGLDMVVRDAGGQSCSAEKRAVIDVYDKHMATQKLIAQYQWHHPMAGARGTSIRSPPSQSADAASCLLLNLYNISTKFDTDVEATFALYDAQKSEFISENFVVYWTGGRGQSTQQQPITAKFTDLGRKDGERERIVLVCRLATIGPIEARDATFSNKKASHGTVGSPAVARHALSSAIHGLANKDIACRQPYGLAACDVSDCFRQQDTLPRQSSVFGAAAMFTQDDIRSRHVLPLHMASDTESLDAAIRKAMQMPRALPSSQFNGSGHPHLPQQVDTSRVDQSLTVSVRLVNDSAALLGPSVTNPTAATLSRSSLGASRRLPRGTTAVPPAATVRKMTFPEVIAADDVRNDLYVTLDSAELAGIRSARERNMRNIEVTAELVDSAGRVIPESMVTVSESVLRSSTFRSLVIYHESKPKWNETFKVNLPPQMTAMAESDGSAVIDGRMFHIRFLFRHRSSNESKDRKEKPFALAWLKLLQDAGTIIHDGAHELLVYKLEPKYEPGDMGYTALPSCKADLRELGIDDTPARGANVNAMFTHSNRDGVRCRTAVCSTSVTQNKNILNVLSWENNREWLKSSLDAIVNSSDDRTGEEIVKFLEHLLVSVFSLLSKTSTYDNPAFDALVHIIRLVDEARYENFKPTIDDFIEHRFSAANVYCKLLSIMTDRVQSISDGRSQNTQLHTRCLNTLKTMSSLMAFTVKSFRIHNKLATASPDVQSRCADEFATQVAQVLQALAHLMTLPVKLNYQGTVLRHLPLAVPYFAQALKPNVLALHLCEIYTNLPEELLLPGRLSSLKALCATELLTANDDVQSRDMLLQLVLRQCSGILEQSPSAIGEHTNCAKLLHQVFNNLFNKNRQTSARISETSMQLVLAVLLRPIQQAVVALIHNHNAADKALLQRLVCLLITLLDESSAHNYNVYVSDRPTLIDKHDFCMELLLLVHDLCTKPVFPAQWLHMNMRTSRTLVETLKFVMFTLKHTFNVSNFDDRIWKQYFMTMAALITQPSLQLDAFEPDKQQLLAAAYKDLRESCVVDVRSMWHSASHKLRLTSELIGVMLRISMCGSGQFLSKTTPVFVDMIGEEYRHTASQHAPSIRAFEHELVAQLDSSVDQGTGDKHFADSFVQCLAEHSAHLGEGSVQYKETLRLIDLSGKLLRRLLEYQHLRTSELDNAEARMSCILNLMEFYQEHSHEELYVKYVYKLYNLHCACHNYAEAAGTLKQHADRLLWCDERLDDILLAPVPPKFSQHASTHRVLKARLYDEIISLYDRGKHWELAIEVCDELQYVYKSITFEYSLLASLLKSEAVLYSQIVQGGRMEPSYYLVGFYGLRFPPFLANKRFVYRGQVGERLADFTDRLHSSFPDAKRCETMDQPSDELKQTDGQLLQVFAVKPIADDLGRLAAVDRNIKWYYKYNNVQKFEYVRQQKRECELECARQSDAARLWHLRTVLVTSHAFPNVLTAYPVSTSETFELHPVQVAAELLRVCNSELSDVIDDCRNSPSTKQLQMKLAGFIDPAVQGGTDKYQCFFEREYLSSLTAEQQRSAELLADRMAAQIPLLEWGLYVHSQRCAAEMAPLHEHLVNTFYKMKQAVQAKYGCKVGRCRAVACLQTKVMFQPSLLPAGASIEYNDQTRRTPHRQYSRSNMHAVEPGDSGTVGRSVSTSAVVHQRSLSINENQAAPSSQSALRHAAVSAVGFRSPLNATSLMLSGLPKAGRQAANRRSHDSKRLSNQSEQSSGDAQSSSPIVLDQHAFNRSRRYRKSALTPSRPRRPAKPLPQSAGNRTKLQSTGSETGVDVDANANTPAEPVTPGAIDDNSNNEPTKPVPPKKPAFPLPAVRPEN